MGLEVEDQVRRVLAEARALHQLCDT